MKIISVVATRPNFVKIAPFCRAIDKHNLGGDPKIEHVLVHAGQHYDERMSELFIKSLGMNAIDLNLGVGSGTHAEQVGNTMIAFERALKKYSPDWVVVVGDVNATIACAITVKKEKTKLAHIEAGLRSGDMDMPEEINRVVTDRLSDLLFTPDKMASQNLLNEGVEREKIKLVGNILIDSMEEIRKESSMLDLNEIIRNSLIDGTRRGGEIVDGEYVVLTLHRSFNVDKKEVLESIVDFLIDEVSNDQYVVWPVHPRTRKRLEQFELLRHIVECDKIMMTEPLGYHEMMRMNMGAKLMLTDSGGLQEECCVLGTPCLVLRDTTERAVTLKEHGGTCVLAGNTFKGVKSKYNAMRKNDRTPFQPELWDGHAAERILGEMVVGL